VQTIRLRPGEVCRDNTYGLIMTKVRQNAISREADKIKQNNSIDYFYFLFLIPTLNKII
jgi:hypothetical protein